MRIIVGISGASGSIFGIRLLELLSELKDIETHLVVSKWGQQTLEYETDFSISEVSPDFRLLLPLLWSRILMLLYSVRQQFS